MTTVWVLIMLKNGKKKKITVSLAGGAGGGGIKANELAENSHSFSLRLVAVLVFEGDFPPVPQSM